MPEAKEKSLFIREMERRANDLVRVYNPLSFDYLIKWDRRGGTKLFRVKAKTETVLIRYIAEKYIKEMFNKILSIKADTAIKAENEARILKGMAAMKKHSEQFEFENPLYNLSVSQSKNLISLLYVGVENEFGIDGEEDFEEEKVSPDKTIFSQALESVQQNDSGDIDRSKTSVEDILENKDKNLDPPVTQKQVNTPKADVNATISLKCDYVDPESGTACDFEAANKAGLMAHKRSHRSTIEKDLDDDVQDKKKSAVAGVSA